jgi:hypothetical protein
MADATLWLPAGKEAFDAVFSVAALFFLPVPCIISAAVYPERRGSFQLSPGHFAASPDATSDLVGFRNSIGIESTTLMATSMTL